MAYEDDEQYGGESSEEKANVERTRIGMRKRGLPESREVETSRQIAMENQAIKSLMQRYRIRDKAEAEERLANTGWLPEPLRLASEEPAIEGAAEEDEPDVALPDFLAGDDEAPEAGTGEDPAVLVAAE